MDAGERVPAVHGPAARPAGPRGGPRGGGRRRASGARGRAGPAHRQAVPRIPPARRDRPGAPGRPGGPGAGRAHQRPRPAADHRDARPHPRPRGRSHRAGHLAHPGRDRAGGGSGRGPARGSAPGRAPRPPRRPRRPPASARPRSPRGGPRAPAGDPGRAGGHGGERADARRRHLPGGEPDQADRGPGGGGGGRRRPRPARDERGSPRPGGALPRAHRPGGGCGPVSHLGPLLLKEERAVFPPPTACPTVAFSLLLRGYPFPAVLFLNRTGDLVRVFFQAAVLFLLIVPVVTMRLFAEERRAGTLELLLTAPVREMDIVLAKFLAGLTLPTVMLALTASYAVVLGIYGDPDWGPIYSGFLGLFLLAAGLTAIGLLASSLAP